MMMQMATININNFFNIVLKIFFCTKDAQEGIKSNPEGDRGIDLAIAPVFVFN